MTEAISNTAGLLRPARNDHAKVLSAFALVIGASLSAVACQAVPITGRSQLLLISEPEEVKMGLQSYQEVLRKSKVSADPAMNDLVRRVGTRIAAATGKADYQWEFKVIEDPQANAFCLPGGKVAVYTGILPITRDRSEERRVGKECRL